MRGIKPMKLTFVTRPFSLRRGHHLGIGVLTYFPLGAEPGLLSEMELWTEVADILGEVAPDLGIPKSRSEYLVVGNAHQEGGEAGPVRNVRARVGDMEKRLYVVGDRRWENGVPTEPAPFTSMPLTWGRAFGGAGFATNPVGRGFAKISEGGREIRPLPNVELPGKMIDSERDRPEPAGFGPVDFTWPQRFSLAGTYDKQWLETRFPGFADDMDWRIWNLAPPDQQREGPFRGDEEVILEHMHPSIPALRGRLPGLRCVCYVNQRTEAGEVFAEVPLKLSTIWLFPEIQRGIAVHHGAHPVAEDDGDDVEAILVGAERLSDPPRGHAHYHDVYLRRTGENKTVESLKDADLLPTDMSEFAPLKAEMAKTTHDGLRRKRLKKVAEASTATVRAELVARGLDPDEHGPTEIPPDPPQSASLDQMGEVMEQLTAKAAELKERAELEKAKSVEELKRFCEETGTDYDQIAAEISTPASGPPEFTADGQRARMRALSDELKAAGTPVDELEYYASHDKPYQEWKLAEEQSKLAYRMAVHMQHPASPASAEVTAQRRRAVEEALAAGQSLADWDLTGVDLSGISLAGADLERAFLESTNFSGATLDGAKLRDAVLAHANLRGASLAGADMTGANLGGSDFTSARLVGARLENTTLTGAKFVGTDLSDAVLDGSALDDCTIEGVVLERASLQGVFFHALELSNVRFAGANLSWASFVQCGVAGVDFSGCTMDDATFFDTRADGARFVKTSARKLRVVGNVSLREADFRGANLEEATLRGANLAKADLSGAILHRADFSKADLSEAKLYRAVARNSMWIRANLRGAMMVSIDLYEAIVEKADLRSADLRGANLYGADFALIRSDAKTTVEDAIQDRVRTLPLREER